uniref:Predicted protein n=1 Tax=Hordeum vulgare subsp. vulgare TaxID=112509 RepID=F2E9K8_HORVV|nr:predicted protein [Hordeum vulgare subsp. vulgare]
MTAPGRRLVPTRLGLACRLALLLRHMRAPLRCDSGRGRVGWGGRPNFQVGGDDGAPRQPTSPNSVDRDGCCRAGTFAHHQSGQSPA